MGAMIATPAFHACNEAFGWRTTLAGLAAVLLTWCADRRASWDIFTIPDTGAAGTVQAVGPCAGAAGGAGPYLPQALGDVLPIASAC